MQIDCLRYRLNSNSRPETYKYLYKILVHVSRKRKDGTVNKLGLENNAGALAIP